MAFDYQKVTRYYLNIKDEKKSINYAYLLNTIPAFALLFKLLERKQKGKCKFSAYFNYDMTVKRLSLACKTIKDELEQHEFEYGKIINYLKIAIEIVDKAIKEIKMDSLKNDFKWINNTFIDALNCLENSAKMI